MAPPLAALAALAAFAAFADGTTTYTTTTGPLPAPLRLARQPPRLFLGGDEMVDVSARLQPLLHGDDQLDAVHHQLGHAYLAHPKGRHVAHAEQCRAFWENGVTREDPCAEHSGFRVLSRSWSESHRPF